MAGQLGGKGQFPHGQRDGESPPISAPQLPGLVQERRQQRSTLQGSPGQIWELYNRGSVSMAGFYCPLYFCWSPLHFHLVDALSIDQGMEGKSQPNFT